MPQHPFTVETLIQAPLREVRRALTGITPPPGPAAHDRPAHDRPAHDRSGDPVFELDPRPDGVLVRVHTHPPEHPDRPDDEQDLHRAREHWRGLLEQLRFLLECHPTGPRRTLRLTGTADPGDVLALVDVADTRHRSRYLQVFVDTDDDLVLVAADRPLAGPGPAAFTLTLTCHGLDETAFAKVRDRWTRRWQAVVKDPGVTG